MSLSSSIAGLSVLLFSAAACPFLEAQAVPTVVDSAPGPGFRLPDAAGSLRYALTASENLIFGYNGTPGTGVNALTNVSGDLAYLSSSKKYPFSAVYSGGYLFGTSNQPSFLFQNLSLSQLIKARRWDFVLGDTVNYLPQTPVTGLSGIPGTGDLNVPPVTIGASPGIGILTEFGTRITNTASGSATYHVTASTSASGTGSYSLQRFISSTVAGVNNSQLSASGNVNHRLDARDSIGSTYTYTQSALTTAAGQSGYGFQSQSITGDFSRELTPRVSLSVSAGPQRTSNSGLMTVSGPSTSVTANASLRYGGRVYTSGLTYSRGVNNGGGVVIGSRSDVIGFNVSRVIARAWNVSSSVGYNRSTQLTNSVFPTYNSSGVVASAQVTRQFNNNISAFGSYTIQRQAFSAQASGLNAFNGLSQVLAFGVSYSPRPFLGR